MNSAKHRLMPSKKIYEHLKVEFTLKTAFFEEKTTTAADLNFHEVSLFLTQLSRASWGTLPENPRMQSTLQHAP